MVPRTTYKLGFITCCVKNLTFFQPWNKLRPQTQTVSQLSLRYIITVYRTTSRCDKQVEENSHLNMWALTQHRKSGMRRHSHSQRVPGGAVILPSMMRVHAGEGEVLRGTFGPGLTSDDLVPGVALHRRVSVAQAGQVDRMTLHDVTSGTD